MKAEFEAFLTNRGLLPIDKWEKITVDHSKSTPDEAELKKFSKKNGIYVYLNQEKKCLYVGKGKPIYNRIRSHWKEAHADKFRSKAQDWFLFFGKHKESLDLYILPLDDELDRQIVEKMLIRVLSPAFEEYRTDQKAIRKLANKKLNATPVFRIDFPTR